MINIIKTDDLLSLDSNLIRGKKNYFLPLLITLCGIAAMITAPTVQLMDSLMMMLFVLGITLIIIGIIGIFAPNKKIICADTKAPLKKYTIFFNPEDEGKVRKYFETFAYDQISKMPSSLNNAKRMATIYTTPQHDYCVGQMYEFVPYEYRPTGEPVIIKR